MESTKNVRERGLTKRIMRRVYLVWSIRLALHPTTLKVFIVALLVFRSMRYVSYTNVLANMPSLADTSAQIEFARSAMHHAQPMALILLSSVAWLSVWIVADTLFRRKKPGYNFSIFCHISTNKPLVERGLFDLTRSRTATVH